VPTNNVVPIDAEVARAIARRAVKFRWFVAGLAALWLGILIPVLVFTPLPPLVPFLVLGALLVLAEHRFVLFGDETSMSGSIIVAVASVFVFAHTAPLAGPMLVASLGGLYLPHLRDRRVSLAVSNGSGFGISALGAAAAVAALGFRDENYWSIVAACVVVAVAADWVVNSVIVGIASAVRSGDSVLWSIRAQLASDSDVFLLAIAVGAFTALNTDRTAALEALCVSLALAAFEIRLKRRQVIEVEPTRSIDRYLNASLIATSAVLVWSDPGLGAFGVVALALFLVQATGQMMTIPAFTGFAGAGVLAACCTSLRAPPMATAVLVLAAAFAAIELASLFARAKRSGRSLNIWTMSGLTVPGPRELAWLSLLAVAISITAERGGSAVASPALIGLAFITAVALANHRSATGSSRYVPVKRG